MKKIISSVLSAALVLGVGAVMPENGIISSYAAWENRLCEFDKSYVGNISNIDYGEYNKYEYIAPDNGYVQFEFTTEGDDTTLNARWGVYLYDEYDRQFYTVDVFSRSKADVFGQKIGVKKGDKLWLGVRVGINSIIYPKIDYTVNLHFTEDQCWEDEFNNSFDTANDMILGRTMNAVLTDHNDKDYFKISAPKTGHYVMEFGREYNDGRGWKIDRYNQYKEYCDTYEMDAGSTRPLYQDVYLEKGDNYLAVSSKAINMAKDSITPYSMRIRGNIEYASVKLSLSKAVYTGKAIKPGVSVKFYGTTLRNGTDYTVSYKNNKKVGNATVTIKGKGSYTGIITKTIKIVPPATSFKKATSPKTKQLKVTYKKVKGVTGYQVTYSTSKKFAKSKTKTVTVKGAAKTSKTIKSLKKGKKYYVKVRTYKTVNGKKYYSAYSKVKTVKVK